MCITMQASFSGLPENTPLVEAVEVGQEAGAPRTAMQIATDKYRSRGEPQPASPSAPEYPEPKKRDQFLEFSVMPCTLLLHPLQNFATCCCEEYEKAVCIDHHCVAYGCKNAKLLSLLLGR